MKNLAKLFPELAWISVSVEGYAGTFVRVDCGLVDDSEQRYYGYSRREAVKAYRQKYGLQGVKLTRINC